MNLYKPAQCSFSLKLERIQLNASYVLETGLDIHNESYTFKRFKLTSAYETIFI